MSRRRSILAEEMIGQQGEEHDIQDDDPEKSDLGLAVMLGEPIVDRLQLPELGEFVAFLELHEIPSGESRCIGPAAPCIQPGVRQQP
jgi:hypothetical protein